VAARPPLANGGEPRRLSAPPTAEPNKNRPAEAIAPAAPATDRDLSLELWAEVLAQINPRVAAELKKKTLVAISGPNSLAIQVPTRYNSVSEQNLDSARVGQIEKALQSLTGRPCKVRIEAITDQDFDARTGEVREASPEVAVRAGKSRATEVKLVQRAMDVLGATIVKEDPGFGTAPDETEASPQATEPQE
jgi:hypothetical protein